MSAMRRFLAEFFRVEQIGSLVLGSAIIASVSDVLLYVIGFLPSFAQQPWPWLVSFLCILILAGVAGLIVRPNRQPRFRFVLGQMMNGPQPGEEQHSSAVILAFNLYNNGGPSIADEWGLKFTSPDGHTIIDGERKIIPSTGLILHANEGGPAMIYPASDAMYTKSIGQPIPTGGVVPGVLLFQMHNLGRDLATRADARWELRCSDSRGNIHRYEFTAADMPIKGGIRHLPGTQMVLSDPAKKS